MNKRYFYETTLRKRSSCTNENMPVGGGFPLKKGPREYLPMEGGIILQQEVMMMIFRAEGILLCPMKIFSGGILFQVGRIVFLSALFILH